MIFLACFLLVLLSVFAPPGVYQELPTTFLRILVTKLLLEFGQLLHESSIRNHLSLHGHGLTVVG